MWLTSKWNKTYQVLKVLYFVALGVYLTTEVINYQLGYLFIPTIIITSLIAIILIGLVITQIRRTIKLRKVKEDKVKLEELKDKYKQRKLKYIKPKVVLGVVGLIIILMFVRDSIGITSKLVEIKNNETIEEYAVLECTNLIENGICGIVDVETEKQYVVFFDEESNYSHKKEGNMFRTLN